jgi:hypothetical protein
MFSHLETMNDAFSYSINANKHRLKYTKCLKKDAQLAFLLRRVHEKDKTNKTDVLSILIRNPTSFTVSC